VRSPSFAWHNRGVTELRNVLAPPTAVSGGVRRRELLDVAADLFAHSGYAGTLLRDVGEAAGILPGSLYHHFASKEALAIELVEAMYRDLEEVSAAFDAETVDPIQGLRQFTREIVVVTARHQAAAKLCLYDAPSTVSPVLAALVHRPPRAVGRVWRLLVDRGNLQGRLQIPASDTRLLWSAFGHAAGEVALLPLPDVTPLQIADTTSWTLLDGLVLVSPSTHTMNASPASAVVAELSRAWRAAARTTPEDRRRRILDAARAAFARRGFDATTMRDVADATDMTAGSLYRYFSSKDELLREIVGHFSHQLLNGFQDVVAAARGPVEALDGLIWLMIHAGRHFRQEFEIVKVWWRLTTSSAPDQTLAENRMRFNLLRGVLTSGIGEGSIRPTTQIDLLTVCVRELMWIPLDAGQVSLNRKRAFMRTSLMFGAAQVY